MYLWSDGSSESSLKIKNSGTYWVRVSNYQCVSSDTISVVFDNYKNMLVTASKDTVSYMEGVQFAAEGSNIQHYQWNFNDGTFSKSQNPYHVFMESGNYNVVVEGTNTNNCIVSKNIPIVVREVLLIPNLFTPNKDNINDNFNILYNGKEQYQLDIFDQLGQQIFTSKEKFNFWDGKNAAEGIYYYSLTIGAKIYKGWIHLVR
jgi:gliding motility-associated-like protein